MNIMQLLGKTVLAGIIIITTSCTQFGPYNTSPNSLPGDESASIDQSNQLKTCDDKKGSTDVSCQFGFVEYDEFGNAFNRRQMFDVLKQIGGKLSQHPIIIVFVHGWHHSAKAGDGNLDHFRQLLMFVKNAEATHQNARPVVGVYLGWRGDSISLPGIKYASFWDRKSVAQSIGHGNVIELMSRLEDFRHADPDKRTMLMIIGHSFGGALVYNALSQSLIEKLSKPADAQGHFNGFGNIILLVNPAFEAMQFKPLYTLSQNRVYVDSQPPLLMMITTSADYATRYAFPIGRFFGTAFKTESQVPHGEMLDITAVGHYKPFITHKLEVANCSTVVSRSETKGEALKSKAFFADQIVSSNQEDKLCLNSSGSNSSEQPYSFVLSHCKNQDCMTNSSNIIENHYFKHIPILNVTTNKTVMKNHDDIWSEPMRNFIMRYLAVYISKSAQP